MVIYINKIMKLPVGQKYFIMEDGLQDVTFDAFDIHQNGQIVYSWSIATTHGFNYTFPMRNNHRVQTYKTLAGAKRNFVRWVQRNHPELISYGNALQKLKARYAKRSV